MEMKYKINNPKLLKILRENLLLSQRKLGNEIGLWHYYITKAENGDGVSKRGKQLIEDWMSVHLKRIDELLLLETIEIDSSYGLLKIDTDIEKVYFDLDSQIINYSVYMIDSDTWYTKTISHEKWINSFVR